MNLHSSQTTEDGLGRDTPEFLRRETGANVGMTPDISLCLKESDYFLLFWNDHLMTTFLNLTYAYGLEFGVNWLHPNTKHSLVSLYF
jgi:hypothetical protein